MASRAGRVAASGVKRLESRFNRELIQRREGWVGLFDPAPPVVFLSFFSFLL